MSGWRRPDLDRSTLVFWPLLLVCLAIIALGMSQEGWFDGGTVHERMVRRLERIGGRWTTASIFVNAALRALDEKGYTIVELSDSDEIAWQIRRRFERRPEIAAVTAKNDRQVILRSPYVSRFGLACDDVGEVTNQILVHEMVHVLIDWDGRGRWWAESAETQLINSLHVDGVPPRWQVLEDDLFEEVLAQLVPAVMFASRGRRYSLPGRGDLLRDGSAWKKWVDRAVDAEINASFEVAFSVSLRGWAGRFTPEEMAILEARQDQVRHSERLRNKLEEVLIDFGLMR